MNRPPPTNIPTESAYSAAQKLGVFTSAIYRWIELGYIAGGCWTPPGRKQACHWVVSDDLRELIREGGRWDGIAKRKQRIREERKRAK